MLQWMMVVAVVTAGVGGLALVSAWRLQRRTGLPSLATIAASDVGQERPRTYRDPEHRLLGKPDYVIRRRVGWRGLVRGAQLVVVEAKPTRRSATLYESDEMELVTNMLAVRAEAGDDAAPIGYVVYENATFPVVLTPDRVARCLAYAARARAVRSAPSAAVVVRTHDTPGRCRRCAVRAACGDAALS